MTRVPRGGGSQEGTTGDLLSHQPEFLGTPLNYYELRESHQKSTRVRGEGQWMQAQMLQMADCGAKPGAILGAITSQHIKLCKQLGIEPKKRAEGGLEGALHDVDAVLMVLAGFIVCFGLI